MTIRKQEIARKLLHLFALSMPVGIYYLPKVAIPPIVPIGILGFVLLGSVVIENLRFRHSYFQKLFFSLFKSMLREEEVSKTTGSTYIVGAALICAIVFVSRPDISFMVLSVFILGDAAAALVGQSIGRTKIGKKSLEGSLGCFCMCLFLFFVIFPLIPGILDHWEGWRAIPLSIISSFCITILELVPLRITKKITINDNLAVPVICGVLILGLEKVFS